MDSPLMKKLYPVVALCALSLLLSGQSKEQTDNNGKVAPPDSSDKNRITLDVSRVNMLYTVSDKKGRFVTDHEGRLRGIREQEAANHHRVRCRIRPAAA